MLMNSRGLIGSLAAMTMGVLLWTCGCAVSAAATPDIAPQQSAQLASPALDSLAAAWQERVLTLWMWTQVRYVPSDSPARQALPAAEQAILAEGRDQAANTLRQLRDGLPAHDPLRLAVAFDMAWLDLDYQGSRGVLFEYNRLSGAGAAGSAQRQAIESAWHTWEPIMGAWARQGKFDRDWIAYALLFPPAEAMPALLFTLWRHGQDPVVLRELLLSGPYSEGERAERLGGIYGGLLAEHPREILTALSPLPDDAWRHAAQRLRHGLERAGEWPGDSFRLAGEMALNPYDDLHPTAQRLFRLIAPDAAPPPVLYPKRPRALAPLARKWEPRVVALGMWVRARRSAPPPPREMVPAAEQAILGEGRSDAAAELRRLRKGLSETDPLRIAVAFAMAWLDLDYPRSRDVLFDYNRSIRCPPTRRMDWEALFQGQRFWQGLLDAHARRHNQEPHWAAYGLISPEDLPSMLYLLWLHRPDPGVIEELLTTRSDGAGAEAVAGVCHDLAANHPRALLEALLSQPDTVWRDTASQSLYEVSERTAEAAFPKLSAIAADPKDPLQPAAQRLLNLIARSRQDP